MPVRILVVDDNRDTLRAYVKALLRKVKPKEGIPGKSTNALLEVEDADTVSLALEKLSSQPFEILVVDLKIPGLSGEEMGGLELIEESIKLDPLRPIITITGFGTIELARKTLTQGVFDFIEKSTTAVEELINAVQRATDSLDEKVVRSGNPFRAMSGIEPTVFGGRTNELEFFEEKLIRALHANTYEHFLVLGDWGIGKSTLLKEYKKVCQSRGHIASIVPLEPLQSSTRLIEAVRSIVEGILRNLPYSVDRFKKVVEFFDTVGVSVLGTGLQFSRDTAKRDLSAQAFLHDTLIKLWQDLEGETEIFVILLDDLDNFMAVPEIVMTLRQTFSMDSIRETHILLGLASTPTSWQELISSKRHHPLSRYFMSRVELGLLSESELQETILRSLADTGVSFNPEVISRVFEYTTGHPFEMQVLCYHLFSNQLSRRVDVNVWDKALQAAIHDMGVAFFDFWFNQASGEETKILRVVAAAETPMSVKEIQETAQSDKVKVSPRNIAKYLQRLVDKDLLIRSGRGLYTIPDRMFRVYISAQTEPK